MFKDVFKNEKLFEKNLTRVPGFECMNQADGLDNKGIIFIMEHRLIIMAPIHERDDKIHKLYIYKICTEIIKPKVKKTQYNKYSSKNSYNGQSTVKNNTSLVELENKQIQNHKMETNLNSNDSIEKLNELKGKILL